MAPIHSGRPIRKRIRKRKRRIVSDSSSSEEVSSSSSSSSEVSAPHKTVTIPVQQSKSSENSVVDGEDESSLSSSSDELQDDSNSDEVDMSVTSPKRGYSQAEPPQRDSPSPQPNIDIPPFISPNASESERNLRAKFRKFWMASIAEGFKDDLEEIRKEPNLGPSRLALLIESLASGADVFSSSSAGGASSVNEMEVILDQLP